MIRLFILFVARIVHFHFRFSSFRTHGVFLFLFGSLIISCSSQTSYTSLDENGDFQSSLNTDGSIYSFVFEAANSGGEFVTDQTAIINESEINLNIITGKDTEKIVPTILFCEDANCITGKTADELGIHYKPRYRSSDASFYSCPAPIPGKEYSEAIGWFETAVSNGWCVKEDRSKIFKDPVTYTITMPDRSTKEYIFRSSIVDGAAKEMLTLWFLQENNSSLSSDVKKTISTHPSTINITLPFGVEKNSLVPTFSITGSKVALTTEMGDEIISSITHVDFSASVDLFVVEADGSGGQAYTVDVSSESPFSEFKLEQSKNPSLSRDYTGVIDHNLKTVAFAFDAGEDPSAVVPTIDLTDSTITITPSADGAQNFGSSIIYNFSPQSGASVDYTVSSSRSPNPGEIIITEVHYDVETSAGFEGGGGTVCTETDDEFVELYNASTASFNLAGMSFQYGTSTGNFSNKYTFPSYTLDPGEYVVLVSKDAGCYNATSMAGLNVLFDTAGWSLSASGATFALVLDATDLPDSQAGPSIDEGTTTVIDYIGTASGANVYQGSQASDCTNKSSARNGVSNTNNNGNDFTCGITNGSPGRENP